MATIVQASENSISSNSSNGSSSTSGDSSNTSSNASSDPNVVLVTDENGGLSLGGYHYAHGKTYYADGRICDAPKLVNSEQATQVEAQASQSRWNFKDYHWEERDTLPVARARLEELLVGTELWRDKRSEAGDALVVTRVDLRGWAVSNVRKGTTKNVFEFEAGETKVVFEGVRGGAQLTVTVAAIDELSHEFLEEAQQRAGGVELDNLPSSLT